MANFIATYDLRSTNPDPHGPFLKEAEKQGWSNWVEASGEMCQLPNTTLHGSFATQDAAIAAFDRAIAATRQNIFGEVVLTGRYISPVHGGVILARAKRPLRIANDLAAALARRMIKM